MKSHIARGIRRIALIAATITLLAGCQSRGPYSLLLMETPEVFAGHSAAVGRVPRTVDDTRTTVLFATDRKPSNRKPSDSRPTPGHYTQERGHVIRLGQAFVTLDRPATTWRDLTGTGRSKWAQADVPIRVDRVETFGILDRSVTELTRFHFPEASSDGAESAFLERLEEALGGSSERRIRIYVHGFSTRFENPLLVAAELAHFMGQDGAFIAYSWPSRPGRFSYFGDTETAQASGFLFRRFLEFLMAQVGDAQIDIVAFSAGTRVVSSALHQIALAGTPDRGRAPFGQVVLVGSDVDRQVFSGALSDGMLDLLEQLSIYLSASDRALSLSRMAWGRQRLGQDLANENLGPGLSEELRRHPKLRFIDVTAAVGSREALGHGYLRRSPWVSSDILMTLMYRLDPARRGLELAPGLPLWTFPDDYVERARASLKAIRAPAYRADTGADPGASGG